MNLNSNAKITFLLFFGVNGISCQNDLSSSYRAHEKIVKEEASKLLMELPVGEHDSLNIEYAGTRNFNLRKPNYIIIHHTGEGNADTAIKKLQSGDGTVSAHYLIRKDGRITQMASDYLRLWHAGVSQWGSNTDMNSISIGVELDNNGYEEFPADQINALIKLLRLLTKTYNIPVYNIIGHSDITYRKSDPHALFPWSELAKNGLGLWYTENSRPANPNLDVRLHLKIIGYDTRDITAAITAFKRHFIQSNDSTRLSDSELSILQDLAVKMMEKN